ncbi:MAG: DUF1656 domain-containing protein [Dokdonella sp.]
MPREIALFDALLPTLFLVFLASLLLQAAIDWLVGRFGFYRNVWHPPLFRLAVFVCVFCGLGLLVTR